jgi:hypothetical protein
LIEVVAGLVLLASLLVGVLQAYGAHHRQLTLSRDRLAATQLADDMLATWHANPRGLPRRAFGRISRCPEWEWRTWIVDRRPVAGVAVEVIRFEIVARAAARDELRLLSSVDVIQAVPSNAEGRTP